MRWTYDALQLLPADKLDGLLKFVQARLKDKVEQRKAEAKRWQTLIKGINKALSRR